MPLYLNTSLAVTPIAEPVQPDVHSETPPSEYDLNCVIPVDVILETDKVVLEPLIPVLHIAELEETSLGFVEVFIRRLKTSCCYVIRDKATQQIAGRIGFNNINQKDRTIELSFVHINQPFRRTHILTHSAYLLISRAFNDLRMTRIVWWPTASNEVSRKAAERLGFEVEGKITWYYYAELAPTSESKLVNDQFYQMTITMDGWDGNEGGREGHDDGVVEQTKRTRLMSMLDR